MSLIALRMIEFYINIGNLQSMKGRMMVKWNWRKSRTIFLRENEHLVACIFNGVGQIQSFPSLKFLRTKNYGTNSEIQFR